MVVEVVFYLLDVGMSNALVLFNLTQSDGQKSSTIVEFNSELIRAFLGTWLQGIPDSVVEHVPLCTDGRFCCAHCALFSEVWRTKKDVAHQGVIFCCVLLGAAWRGKIVSKFATPIQICTKQFWSNTYRWRKKSINVTNLPSCICYQHVLFLCVLTVVVDGIIHFWR